MTTVYNKSFSANISRITESSLLKEKKSDVSASAKTEFKTILADLESKKEQENRQLTEEVKKIATAEIKSVLEANKEVKEPVIETKNIPNMPIADNSNYYQTVKFTGLDVKSQTAEAPPPISQELDLNKLLNTKIKIVPLLQPLETQINDQSKLLDDKEEIKNTITAAGKYFGIDPNLGLAVAEAESSFNVQAVSKDGYASKGLFQLLDSTAGLMKGYTGTTEDYDPFDSAQNTYLGMGYLRRLHDLFSSKNDLGFNIKTQQASSAEDLEKLAVAAFNAGEGSVAKAQQQAQEDGKDPTLFSSIESYLPKSTQSYVEKVNRLRENYLKEYQKNKIS